jgi:hypothetical protein
MLASSDETAGDTQIDLEPVRKELAAATKVVWRAGRTKPKALKAAAR